MISRRTALAAGLVLCVLTTSAFSAANVSAASLTAVICKETAGVGVYNNSHCETPKVLAANYDTVALALNTLTGVEGTSTGVEPTVRATVAGANYTFKCGTGHVIGGSVKNEEPEAGFHKISGTATRATYTDCHAYLKANEARFCAVEGITAPGGLGEISTTALKGATTGVEHQVKIEPQEGTLISEFKILKAGSVPGTENTCFLAVNVLAKVKGSVEGEANTETHSHLTFTEANNGNGLEVNNANARYIDTVGFTMEGEPERTVGAQTFT